MNNATAEILREGSSALGRALIGRGGQRADVNVLLDNLVEEGKQEDLSEQESLAFKLIAENLECALKMGSVKTFQASQALKAADDVLTALGLPIVTI